MKKYLKALFDIIKNYHFYSILILVNEAIYYKKYNNAFNKFKYLDSNYFSDSIPCSYFFLKKIKNFIIKNNIKFICDLGSGYGKILYYLGVLNNFKIDGIEFEKEIYLESLKLKNENIQIFNKDILNFNMHDKYQLLIINDPLKKDKDFNKLIQNIKNIYKDLKDENERNDIKKILAVGRLTKQKNFIYLLQEFEKFLKVKQNYRLTILGEGEKKNQLEKFIKEKKISEYVQLKGRVKNVFSYMKSSDLFVLSSLWEDPGFVIIEAAFCNLFIISSNCPNGPTEILDKGNAGILFNSNEKNALLNSLIKFDKMDKDLIFKLTLVVKELKESRNSLKILNYIDEGNQEVRSSLLIEVEELIAITSKMIINKKNL